MKILFVLEYYHPNIGGVERLFKALTEYLADQGHEVLVLTNRYKRDLPKQEVINGVVVRRLRFWNRFFFTFFSLPWVIRYGRNYDLIHTTSFNAALPAYLGAKWLRKKVSITFHEVWDTLWFQLPFIGWLNSRLYYMYEKMILRLAFDRIVAVSKYSEQCLCDSGVEKNRISLIYNGLEYSKIDESKADDNELFTFAFFGRLGPSKGIDLLMQASMEFLNKVPDSQMKLIIGKQPTSIFSYVQHSINSHGLNDRIELLHQLSDRELQFELKSSSCVVIPSISEGFCFAAAESVALGVPIISSQRGALKEVVSGRFIAMNNYTTEALVEALKQAYKGDWTTEEIKRFQLSDSLDKYVKLYEDLLKG